METYTITPRAGTYKVVATAEDGKRTVVANHPTEQAAVSHLRRLQEKAGIVRTEPRVPQGWRG